MAMLGYENKPKKQRSCLAPGRVVDGREWLPGMKAHIRYDMDWGFVYMAVTTPANESDVSQIDALLNSNGRVVHGDAGHFFKPS